MKDTNQLEKILEQAQASIVPGTLYYHYKHPDKQYKIITLAFLESSEEVSVVYQALYPPYFNWIRPLHNFLETISVGGKEVARFTKIEA